jgi:hypothetical protein
MMTAAISERHYYEDFRNRQYMTWSVKTLAHTVASIGQYANPEDGEKFHRALDNISLDTPAEAKFKEAEENKTSSLSVSDLTTLLGGGKLDTGVQKFEGDVGQLDNLPDGPQPMWAPLGAPTEFADAPESVNQTGLGWEDLPEGPPEIW